MSEMQCPVRKSGEFNTLACCCSYGHAGEHNWVPVITEDFSRSIKWRAHIRKDKGFYRVFWRSMSTGIIYEADRAPYSQRRAQTKAANAFVLELNKKPRRPHA